MPHDLTRSARALKILGPPGARGVRRRRCRGRQHGRARGDPGPALRRVASGDADVAAPLHSYAVVDPRARPRPCSTAGSTSFARVYEQLTHLPRRGTLGPRARTRTGPACWPGGRTDTSMVAMQAWMARTCCATPVGTSSSFVPVMRRLGVRLGSVELDSHSSQWRTRGRVAEGPGHRRSSRLRAARGPAPSGRRRSACSAQTLDEMETTLAVAIASRTRPSPTSRPTWSSSASSPTRRRPSSTRCVDQRQRHRQELIEARDASAV